jgi:hypothetical protein
MSDHPLLEVGDSPYRGRVERKSEKVVGPEFRLWFRLFRLFML